MRSIRGAYTWGEEHTETLAEMKQAVHSYLTNELDNGPGRVVSCGPGAWDIEVALTLRKKPPRQPPRFLGSGT